MANASQAHSPWLDNARLSWGSSRLPRGFPSLRFQQIFLSTPTPFLSFTLLRIHSYSSPPPSNRITFFLGFSTKSSDLGAYHALG